MLNKISDIKLWEYYACCAICGTQYHYVFTLHFNRMHVVPYLAHNKFMIIFFEMSGFHFAQQ